MAERRSRRRTSSPGTPPRSTAALTDQEQYQRWVSRVAHARRVREDWARRYLVETCERFFLGNQHEYGDLHPWFDVQENEPTFNYIWATIQAQLPALYYQNPTFNVTPLQPAQTAQAEQAAAMEERLLDVIAQEDRHLKLAGQLAVLQNYFRLGVLKIIYDPRLERNPQAGEIVYQTDPTTGRPLLNPTTMQPVPVLDPATGEPVREPERILTDEVYRWRWVDAACMLLPDQGPDRSRWTWLGEEVYVPLEVAQDDTRFPASLRNQLTANSRGGAIRPYQTGYGEQPTTYEQAEDYLHYYECWDIFAKRYYIWADGQPFGDEWLVNDDFPPGVEDHPYAIAMGYNTPILGPRPSPWPVPIIFQWLSIQREYNTRRKQITQGAGRSARKVLYMDSTFPDEDEATKALASSEDLAAVKINNLEQPPIYMQDPPLNVDILRDVLALQADWRAIAGVPAAQLQTIQAGQSPTEAGQAAQFASQRDLVMRDVITELFVEAGTKMSQRIKATLTLEKLVKIRQLTDQELQGLLLQQYGPQIGQLLQNIPNLKQLLTERFGQEKWLRVTRDSVTFASQVSIVPGSMRARTTEVERQQLLSFLSTLGQAPQIALSRELLRVVARAFEIESEPLLDELNALAHQMVEVNARQAGRYQGQGGDNAQSGSAQNTPALNGGGSPQVASQLMMALMRGGR